MLLRVFAVTDDSEIGLACLEWVQFMLALDMPLRIASATGAAEIMGDRAGRSPNPWARVRSFFATPLEDEYINIVLSPINTWDRFWAARARRNIAIVPGELRLDELLAAKPVRPFDAVVHGGDGTDWAEQIHLKPISANLERFRAVILG